MRSIPLMKFIVITTITLALGISHSVANAEIPMKAERDCSLSKAQINYYSSIGLTYNEYCKQSIKRVFNFAKTFDRKNICRSFIKIRYFRSENIPVNEICNYQYSIQGSTVDCYLEPSVPVSRYCADVVTLNFWKFLDFQQNENLAESYSSEWRSTLDNLEKNPGAFFLHLARYRSDIEQPNKNFLRSFRILSEKLTATRLELPSEIFIKKELILIYDIITFLDFYNYADTQLSEYLGVAASTYSNFLSPIYPESGKLQSDPQCSLSQFHKNYAHFAGKSEAQLCELFQARPSLKSKGCNDLPNKIIELNLTPQYVEEYISEINRRQPWLSNKADSTFDFDYQIFCLATNVDASMWDDVLEFVAEIGRPIKHYKDIPKIYGSSAYGEILGFSTKMTVKDALINCKRLGLNFERAGVDQLRCIGKSGYFEEVSIQLRQSDLSDIVIIKIKCGVTKSCGADASQISDAIASKGVFVEFDISSRSIPSEIPDIDLFGDRDPTSLSLLPRLNDVGCATDGVQVLCLGGQTDSLSVGLVEIFSAKERPSAQELKSQIFARLNGVIRVKGSEASLSSFSWRDSPQVNFSKAKSFAQSASRSNFSCKRYAFSRVCGGSNFRELETSVQFIDRRYRTGASDWDGQEKLVEVEIFVLPNEGDLTSAGRNWGTGEDKITVNGVEGWEDVAGTTSGIRISCETYNVCAFDQKLVLEVLSEMVGVPFKRQKLDRRITVINKNGIKSSQPLKGRPQSIDGFGSASCGLVGSSAICFDGQNIWLVENKEYLYDLSGGSTGLNF